MKKSRRGRSAAAYLASRTRFGVKFGLETIHALVAALGHPERAYATVLVAGTNGKGSVVAYTDAVLRASGLRVGRYTSPHLVHIEERIAVNGVEIDEAAFESAVEEVRATAEALVQQGVLPVHPTHFEVLTAAAFVHFRREAVTLAVLEVGMGGRLDATNVAEPLASAVVSIDLDHERYLGTTLEAIAREKAGVLRRGRATVLGPLPPAARGAVAAVAEALAAVLVDFDAGVTVEQQPEALLRIATPGRVLEGISPLPGAHQAANVLVALRLLEEIEKTGVPIAWPAAPTAIASTRWRGRLQWIPGDPPLLLDGAHNPAGARALAAWLRDSPAARSFVLLFGVMEDKDVQELARILLPLAREVVLTRPPVERAATPEVIVSRVGAIGIRAHQESDPRRALALARRLCRPGEPVVVAGSLYLVGEVLGILEFGKG